MCCMSLLKDEEFEMFSFGMKWKKSRNYLKKINKIKTSADARQNNFSICKRTFRCEFWW